ncbi:MAG: PAS domain S-box protein, partial [Chloroflexi bacterium]|nr:PAS domain S-box protein [Chloroflexota bacterium]
MSMIPAGLGSIALFLLAGLAAALIGAQRWSVRARRPEAGTGALILWCGAVVMLSNALHLLVPGVQAKLFFARAQVGGVFPVPMLWFYLTMQFTGNMRWMTRRRVVLAGIPVAAILFLLLTDPLHHLMILPGWSLPEGDLQRLSFSYGLPVWIYAIHGHAQVVVGSSLLAYHMIRRPGFRWQGTVLLSVATLCVLANISDLATSGTRPSFDLTPLALLVAVPVFVLALVRLQRADLVPIARSSVIETMQDGLLVVDGRDRVLDLNPAAGRILGAEPGLVRGKELTGFWPDWPEKQAGLSATTRPTGEISFPYCEGGREYEVTTSRLRDWLGHNTGQVLVFRNVTARRQAEAALRASEQRLRSAFESTLVGVYQLAPDGRVLFANRALARILGFDTSGEFSRRGPDQAAAILAATLRSGASSGSEVRGRLFSWRLPNGATLQLRENARVVRSASGETLYFEGTIEDVTELVVARDTLQRKAAYLQALNRIITAGAEAHDISQILDAALPSTLEALELTAGGIWAEHHERSYDLPGDVQAALAGLGRYRVERLEISDVLQILPDD